MTLEKRTVDLPSGRVAYADEGEGPPVILLHGYPTSSHLWRDLAPMLAPRFRAIAPDLLGYGDSEKPHDPERMTIRAQARMVRELLDALGVRDELAVVGHDIGGGVAQLLALEGGVRVLALLDAISFDSWPIDGVRMLQQAPAEKVDDEFVRRMVTVALETGMSEPERLQDADRRAYVEPWLPDPMAAIRAARAIDGVGLVGTEERLAALESRALIVWGEDDPYQPAALAERLGETMPGATVALLPGCSHFVTEDAPEAVLPVVVEYLRVHHLGETHGHEAGPVAVDLGVSFDRPERPSSAEGFDDLG